MTKRTRVERFCRYIAPRGDDSCWEWRGAKSGRGYGSFHWGAGRGNIGSHQASYEIFVGPIPDGQYVCHRCDSPPCCNPGHLFLGSALDNTTDAITKGRKRRHLVVGDTCKNGHAITSPKDLKQPPSFSGPRCRRCYCVAQQKTVSKNRPHYLQQKRDWLAKNRCRVNARRREAYRLRGDG